MPFYKSPNATMRNNRTGRRSTSKRWHPDAIPVTSYKPRGDRAKYDADYTHWGDDRDSRAGPLSRCVAEHGGKHR